ncbi:diphosphomevalonate/phosphomevalonate decarboxylase [Kipferlia bialata]|uniref:Diphosphomevalonate/phosphomevalonate decarboxylase n=1 Tax=Kipferlia bialata TaxID=797122 RepID=A0A9K3GKD8_9EUKA|nr:diphosphomevalonate/phosphomevalonate decarboxylase [Kipferlia bialata]|eukprot:g7175.t1
MLGMDIYTETRVELSRNSTSTFSLNGKTVPLSDRAETVLRLLSSAAGYHGTFRIETRNSFPTGAGMASSASGIAALTMATYHALRAHSAREVREGERERELGAHSAREVREEGASQTRVREGREGERERDREPPFSLPLAVLSGIARRGSGSAARSLLGGCVLLDTPAQWGEEAEAAVQSGIPECLRGEALGAYVADTVTRGDRLIDMVVYIAVVSSSEKKVGSTKGMQISKASCPFMSGRVCTTVPVHMQMARRALSSTPVDYPSLFDVTMMDSDSLHLMCASSVPRIDYMTPVSWSIVSAIRDINAKHGKTVVGYSFDAGANPFVFTTKAHAPEVKAVLEEFVAEGKASSLYETGVSVSGPIVLAEEGSRRG